jgi:predicted lipoprotein with Yx(FWY)xxD motif
MAQPRKNAKLMVPAAGLGIVAVAVLAILGSSGAAAKPNHGSARGGKGVAIGVKQVGGLGSVLYAGPKKLTVYAFTADHGSKSSCSGACATAWPPVMTSAKPQAQSGASASDLGTTKRGGGVEQVTYKGHPLYFYGDDKTAATAKGQRSEAFGGSWYVLGASGSYIMTKPKSATTTTTTEKNSTPPPPAPTEEKKPPAEEKKPATEWG